jgi:hypothetical protein
MRKFLVTLVRTMGLAAVPMVFLTGLPAAGGLPPTVALPENDVIAVRHCINTFRNCVRTPPGCPSGQVAVCMRGEYDCRIHRRICCGWRCSGGPF